MDREQHLPHLAIGDVAVLEGDGSRLAHEDVFQCTSWAEGVPAPVDADGNVVPLTTRTLYDGDGHEITTVEYSIIFSKDTGIMVWSVRSSCGLIMALNRCHLERPDSLERLEADVELLADCYDVCDYFNGTERKDHDCDHDDGFCCDLCVARDIMRRAKALSGVVE